MVYRIKLNLLLILLVRSLVRIGLKLLRSWRLLRVVLFLKMVYSVGFYDFKCMIFSMLFKVLKIVD